MAQASDIQHGIWFTEQAGAAGTAYHLAVAVWFDGELDVAVMLDACADVVARHDALRVVVRDDDGVLRLVEASALPSVVQTAFTETLAAQEVARPFDLRHGPLARFTLARVSDARHLLLFVAHHLVFDGISKEILLQDLSTAYNAAVDRTSPPLPPLSGSYREQVAAERERAAGVDLATAARFWNARWREPGEAVLPGLMRTPITAEPGAALEFDLDAGLIADVSATLGVTRFEVLLSAIRALLHRYGDPAPMIVIDLSSRTRQAGEHIGHFVNELPVAVAANGAESFRVLAGAVRAELRELYDFRAVPLTRAVSGLRPRAALAPVSVSYRRRGLADPKFVGVDANVSWLVFNHAARNALHIQLVDSLSSVAVSLQYSPSAIEPAAVARIAGHLRTLLAAIAADPDVAVADLDVLSGDEFDRQVVEWNATQRPYPTQATLVNVFAAQVAATPQAVAVVAGEQELTYAQLDQAVTGFAARLGARGVNRGDLVAVCLPRSVRALVALLAIGRVGAAYLPVDPGYPAARRALVLADAAPALVVTAADLSADLDPALAVLTFDDPALASPAGPAFEGGSPVGPDPADLAYVIYTSGSTGRPKGVAVPHRALINLLFGLRDTLASRPDDAWLWLTSLSFDIFALEAYLPLITGGRVVIAPEASSRDGAALVELIGKHAVTHVQATPSGWRMLLDSGFGDSTVDRPVVALAGGEALPVPLAAQLRARVSRLFNVYGPTETTIWSTVAELPEQIDQVTIGRPIANTQIYLLDDQLRPVSIGLPGELCIGGAGVALGYLVRPELTDEWFVADPFGSPGDRLYRTGDRARYLPDGRIVFLGRSDNQVKIRGHRVELGEIEARLLEHPEVAQAAVALHDGDDGDAQLVGYLVPQGIAPEPAALRAHLALTLPAATVPSTWVILDRLPLTPNGKLDRAALPEPPRESAPPAPAAGEAADELTEQVRQIWQEVLRLDPIGLDDDLFDLGGHSLMITRIISRIRKQLGVNVPLDVFYDTPTIRDVVAAMRQLSR